MKTVLLIYLLLVTLSVPSCDSGGVDRYDYLEFKDSHGKIVKCDEQVGATSWPKVLKFPNCSRLQFSFRSDSSGVDWGYKFKVYIVRL